jgi:hypothetical protein
LFFLSSSVSSDVVPANNTILGVPLYRSDLSRLNSFDMAASAVSAPLGVDLMSINSFTAGNPIPSSTAIIPNSALGGPLTRIHSLDPNFGYNLTGSTPIQNQIKSESVVPSLSRKRSYDPRDDSLQDDYKLQKSENKFSESKDEKLGVNFVYFNI